MTIHIEPHDDATKKRLLKAVAARGQASGIEAAAKLIAMMADHKRRVVGTSEVKALAEALSEKAAEIKAGADLEIAELERATKL